MPGVKTTIWAMTSLLAVAATVSYAVHTRQQFYPTVVFLVTSKISVVILVNFCVLVTFLFGHVMKKLFLGTLREMEIETICDRSRYAITETCLALTIFHEELTLRVFSLFTALLFSKVFHWLTECRVDHIEQAEGVTRLQHCRLIGLVLTLVVTDTAFLSMCAALCIDNMPSVLILFGFEYAILLITELSTLAKYGLNRIDVRIVQRDGIWAWKGAYQKILDFMTEAFRFALLVLFFAIVFTYYGMPLHIVRELYMSYNNLSKCWQQYLHYRRLMMSLNARFPDATPEEMMGEDGNLDECIICRDTLTPGSKKLPCGHVFHLECLRNWLHSSENYFCPICRAELPADGGSNNSNNNNAAAERAEAAERRAGAAGAAAAGAVAADGGRAAEGNQHRHTHGVAGGGGGTGEASAQTPPPPPSSSSSSLSPAPSTSSAPRGVPSASDGSPGGMNVPSTLPVARTPAERLFDQHVRESGEGGGGGASPMTTAGVAGGGGGGLSSAAPPPSSHLSSPSSSSLSSATATGSSSSSSSSSSFPSTTTTATSPSSSSFSSSSSSSSSSKAIFTTPQSTGFHRGTPPRPYLQQPPSSAPVHQPLLREHATVRPAPWSVGGHSAYADYGGGASARFYQPARTIGAAASVSSGGDASARVPHGPLAMNNPVRPPLLLRVVGPRGISLTASPHEGADVSRTVPTGAVFVVADELAVRGDGSGATTFYRTIDGDWASDGGRPGADVEVIVAPPPPLASPLPLPPPHYYYDAHPPPFFGSPSLVRPPQPPMPVHAGMGGAPELAGLLAEVKKLREEIAAMKGQGVGGNPATATQKGDAEEVAASGGSETKLQRELSTDM